MFAGFAIELTYLLQMVALTLFLFRRIVGGKVVANWLKKKKAFSQIRVENSKSTRYILRAALAIRARYN